MLLVSYKKGVRIIGKFCCYSLLAGGMASILLIPEVLAIYQTDFGAWNFPTELKSYFSILDELARHCLNVTTERGLEHWPNIYCGVAVFILIPLYLFNDKISLKQRFLKMLIAGFLLLSFSTNILDFMWHGMNYPDSLPARQSFIYIFLILTMCYEAVIHLKEIEAKNILYSYSFTVVFLLFCEKFIEHEDFTTWIEVLTLVFVTIFTILLYYYRTRDSKKLHIILFSLALATVIVEAGINTYNTSVGTTSRTAYLEQLPAYKELYEQVQDDTFFRVEKFTRKTKNDGTLIGVPTASLFSSTLNSNVTDLYKKLGMRYSKVFYGFDGATAFTSALLNVNYMFNEEEEEDQKTWENGLYSYVDSHFVL